MLGWTNIGICVIAAILFYKQGHRDFFWFAVTTGVVAFGSHVITQNRLRRTGYGELRRRSNWLSALLSALYVLSTLVGIVLFVTALAFKYW
jgi:hypothetical protein